MTTIRPTGYVIALNEATGEWRTFYVENGQRREQLTYRNRARGYDFASAAQLIDLDHYHQGGALQPHVTTRNRQRTYRMHHPRLGEVGPA